MGATDLAADRSPRPQQQVEQFEAIIIGAGFAGLEIARALGRAGIETLLVDKSNHHLFQPLLYQVATAALSATDVAEPIRRIVRRYRSVRVVLGEVETVDTGRREVCLTCGLRIGYRYLVLAAGSRPSYFGHDGWAQHASGLKTIEDARRLRSQLLLTFERAEREADPAEQDRLLSIAIIGGGPTGVELAGAVAELSRYTLARDFRSIDPTRTRITLIEGGSRLLSGLSPRSSTYATARLATLGVDVRCNSPVQAISELSVTTKNEILPVGLVIWAAGVSASPLAAQLGVTDKGGRIVVDAMMRVPGQHSVYALGDIAAQTGPDGKPLPGLAQVARQQGLHLGVGLAGLIRHGKDIEPFRYRPRGDTAIIGRHAAVFEHRGQTVTGWTAWVAWALIHIYLLIGFPHRLSVAIQWLWRYLTYDRGARLIAADVSETDPQGQKKSDCNEVIEPHTAQSNTDIVPTSP